jgi:hypothetical protein
VFLKTEIFGANKREWTMLAELFRSKSGVFWCRKTRVDNACGIVYN